MVLCYDSHKKLAYPSYWGGCSQNKAGGMSPVAQEPLKNVCTLNAAMPKKPESLEKWIFAVSVSQWCFSFLYIDDRS